MSEKPQSKRDFAVDLFRSYKTGFIKKKKIVEQRSNTPGDPTLISNVLSELIEERDWNSGLAEGTLFATWAQVVGADIAQHTTPLSLLDGRLLVQCSSTAWATQLNLVGPSLLETIRSSAPGRPCGIPRFHRAYRPQLEAWPTHDLQWPRSPRHLWLTPGNKPPLLPVISLET